MIIEEFINELAKKNIYISVSEGNLKIKTKEPFLADDLLNSISSRKKEILDFYDDFKKEINYDSISKSIEKEHYVSSSAQQRLYFLYEFDKASLAYNMPQVVRLEGELDRNKLQSAFQVLVDRHEILRTSLQVVEDEVVQRIDKDVDFKIEFHRSKEQEVQSIIGAFIRPFDLSASPLIRVGLIQLSEEEHVLMVDVHHVASDGASQGILINDFMSLYNDEELADLDLHYKDYSEWQQSDQQQERLVKQQEFWVKEFSAEVLTLDLPADYVRPQIKNYSGGTVGFNLNKEETNQLRRLNQKEGVTMFMTTLSIFNVLLGKLSNVEDIVIGTPTAGRNHADLEGMMGMFVNTLALRNYPERSTTFKEFLSKVKERTLECFDNQAYQYEELIDVLNVTRDTSRNPLFDVMFAYQNFETSSLSIPGLTLKPYTSDHQMAKFDLNLSAVESANKLHLSLEYSKELFSEATIERFISYFKLIVTSVISDAAVKLSDIEILSKTEKQELLYDFNDTAVDYPREKTVIDLFEEQVTKTPEKPALVFDGEELSYQKFNERVNHLTEILIEKGIQPGDIVGIIGTRSLDLLVGIFGILKSGGAYLPIDPSLPEERINYMLEDSQASLLLVSSAFKAKIRSSIEQLELDKSTDLSSSKVKVKSRAVPDGLAYVIYTSGSTGSPKGVMVSHRSVTNLISCLDERYPFKEGDRFLFKTNYMFDVSIAELFGWFTGGGSLVILPPELEADMSGLLGVVEECGITHINFAPSIFSIFLQELNGSEHVSIQSIKYIFLAGEALPMSLVHSFESLGTGVKLENIYGPTEGTVYSSGFSLSEIGNGKVVPIGKPFGNVSLLILDKSNNLQPKGVVGELCIGGVGLALGYLNNEELTAEKFITNPYNLEERLYKTGDLARWLPDGNIEFLGRIDDQVKIRGFRIELGEIESQLLTYDQINEVVVLAQEREGDKYLIGYYVSEEEIESMALRSHLSVKLPEYMVPSYYVHLEHLPITVNGKLDRKSLPDPEFKAGDDYVAPRNEIEEKLVEIWSDLLEIEREVISINQSFFALGGHSLKAMVLVNQISKALSISLSLKDLFSYQDIRSLSEYISGQDIQRYSQIIKSPKKEHYWASSAQKRLYFLYEFDKTSLAYNIPQVVRLEGGLDRDKLGGVFKRLIDRHEILRTSIEVIEDEVVQKIHGQVDFKIEFHESDEQGVQSIIDEFIRPFDLSVSPLIRVGLTQISEEAHILMVDVHHIASDGASQGILINDFMSLYNDEELPELELQYKDYSQWQRSDQQQEVLIKQQEFWVKEFSEEVQVLNLPTDNTRPKIKNHSGDTVSFTLGKVETGHIRSLGQQEGATMFMTILSIFNVLLAKLSNVEDIVIGTPSAGRGHSDLEGMIGMFVNTLALRNYPRGATTFKNFLSEVKERTLQCFDHQSYQYEELIDALNVARDTSRNPLFDVMFAYHNFESKELNIPGLTLKPYSNAFLIAKFDITLSVMEFDDELYLDIRYSKELFKKETIERFISYFKRIVASVTTNANIEISDIDMLSVGEKHKVLYEFNDTLVDYPNTKTIVNLFEEQVERTPEKIALALNGDTLTYEDLNNQSNQLAKSLREKGIDRNMVVGVTMERSFNLIVSIVGVLKAGAAYLPIDSNYPENRVSHMLKDSGAKIVLVDTASLLKARDFIGLIINVDEIQYTEEIASNIPLVNDPSDLFYVIYTSGSTGLPKGVMLTHLNLVNLIYNDYHSTNINFDCVLQFAAISFDRSFHEIFTALLWGGKLVIVEENDRLDFNKIFEIVKEHKVKTFWMSPSVLNQIFDDKNSSIKTATSIEHIITSGEQVIISEPFKNYLRQNKVYLHNHYGPSETHVVTTFTVDPNFQIPSRPIIGKPIQNTNLFILDQQENIQAINVSGELYIGGVQVGKGYLNNEDLTAEKFIENPFVPDERLYRTGDLARWLPDGNVEFLGRIDDQIKIRGFRVELGEIESQLLTFGPINEIVVLAKDQLANKYLIGYYVSEDEISTTTLRSYLSEKLPDYMLPSYFVHLDSFPFTSNGKLDRKALPDPEFKSGDDYVAPRNEIEEKLVEVWGQVLGVHKEEISIESNFFELGGHSLKAMQLVNQLSRSLNISVPVRDLFTYQDIRSLSEYISGLETQGYSQITKAPERAHYLSSSAQQRLYFLYVFDKMSLAYNMPQIIKLEGRLDRDKLEGVFKALIDRHEILRTSLQLIEGEVVQKVNEQVDFKIEFHVSEEQEVESIVEGFIRPFDLNHSPLIRVSLIQVSEEEHVLMVDMHHIVSDGASKGVLINDFKSLYSGEELPNLELQYKDYSEWQRNELQQELLVKQKEFWINEFSEEVPALDLPADYSRPKVKDHSGHALSFSLDEKETTQLRTLSQQEGATMFMTILSVFNVFLGKLSNKEDIVVGTPTAGRNHSDLEGMIGMFVNTLALRNYPKGEKGFREFLSDVKERTLECFENQTYQYEELIDALSVMRDVSRNPLFDVMFSYQNFETSSLTIPGLTLKPYSGGRQMSKFDLTVSAVESEDKLHLNIEYSTGLFKEATIERFVSYFKRIVTSVISDATVKLSDIDILSEEEKDELLHAFNDTAVDYPRDKTIIDLFEAQVDQTPDNIALIFNSEALSYRELSVKVDLQCKRLQDAHVKSADIVGLMVDRSTEMMIGILAILKSGAAYLPIDTNLPQDRIRFMLDDSKATLLLTEGEKLNLYSDQVAVIDIHSPESIEKAYPDQASFPSSQLAYIIYTSGSTGEPKGVMVAHQSVVNLVSSLKQRYEIKQSDRVLLFSNISFDASVVQMWLALLSGSSLAVIDTTTILDTKLFNEYLAKTKVTHLHTTPSFLSGIELTGNNTLKRIIVGGEKCPVDLAKKYSRSYEFYNSYGPTEATVTTHLYQYKGGKLESIGIPLGQQIANTKVYVLGKNADLQPKGVAGELYIGGVGLALGYLNNPGLTGKKFKTNPFIKGRKIYQTGDLARWLPDGNIEYLGRLDDQVKIRGFRIELGEIESQLLTYDHIKEVVVLAQEREGDKFLIGYYVSEEEIESTALRSHLSTKLPEYMIPSYYVHLERLPITTNGKLDRRALPDPEFKAGDDYEAPRNEIEEKLVEIWSKVLGINKEEISIGSNFFELGGHSLKTMLLHNKISNAFDMEISLADIFSYPTIKKLIQHYDLNINVPRKSNDLDIVLLKKEPQAVNNIFFIHDGSGDVNGYLDLVKTIDNHNCWGIRCKALSELNYVQLDIPSLAEEYIKQIKSIQEHGPYHLVGWSLGGLISHEIVRQLEESKEYVRTICMIDTVLNKSEDVAAELIEFDLLAEMTNTLLNIFKWKSSEIENVRSFNDMLDLIQKEIFLNKISQEELILIIPEELRNVIPNAIELDVQSTFLYYKALTMLRHAANEYKPSDKLKASLVYLKASKTQFDSSVFSGHYESPIVLHEFISDHFSIVKEPIANDLGRILNKVLLS